MAGTIKGQVVSGTPTSILNDGGVSGNGSLTTLANGSAAISATQDNTPATGNAELWATFQLKVVFTSAPTAGSTIDLYIIYAIDGTNFDDASAGSSPITNNAHYVGSFPLRAVTGAQLISLRGVPMEFAKWQAQLVNNSGQSLGAQNSGQQLIALLQDLQY